MKRAFFLLLVLVTAACSSGGAADTTTSAPQTTTSTTASPPDTAPPGPAMSPAELRFEDQQSDGSSVVIASVTLPSPGFVVIHADGGGSPGAVIGHSGLLEAGTNTDVVVTLDESLSGSAVVWPMVHIDVNENGIYEFAPPEETVDGPAQLADGSVAVVSGEVTVPSAAPTVRLSESSMGSIVTDGAGNTLYLFTPDNQGDSTCYDQCEANWPPLTGSVEAGEGLDASLLGTTVRDDGSTQVTYNGWPLYYFANDQAPGDTNGQGIGDVWYVVDVAGNAVAG